MCGKKEPGYTVEKGIPKTHPNEMTPSACGDATQVALNQYDEPPTTLIAKHLRNLCRWLSRIYTCVDARIKKLEMRKVTDEVILERHRERFEKLETSLGSLIARFDMLEASTPNNTRIVQLEDLIKERKEKDTPPAYVPAHHLIMSKDQAERFTRGTSTSEEILDEMEKKRRARTLAQELETRETFRETAERLTTRPRFCSQCGEKV